MAKKKAKKKQTLIERGFHVYLGTIRVQGEPGRPPSILPEPAMHVAVRPGSFPAVVTHDKGQGGCGAHTSVMLHPDDEGKPFAYTCSGCGQRLRFGNLARGEPAPPKFHLFGDESTAKGIVTYGLVVLNESDLLPAEHRFRQVIGEAGVPPDTRFHCKELFSGQARAATPWAAKGEFEVWETARALLASLKLHRAMFCVGSVDVSTYPERMPDGEGKEIRLLPEHHYGMAFQAAIGCVDTCGLLRPEVTASLWIDPQETKIDLWGCGGVRVRQLLKARNLEPEKIEGPKPVLLDAADIFAYVAGRALSPEDSRYKRQCVELFEACSPIQAKGWWQPEEPGASREPSR